MTRDDCELIAEVLRRRIVKIREMFQAPDTRVPDVQQFAKVQTLVLAHDLGLAFAKDDATFDDFLVKTVQDEMYPGQ
jgi:hypothetical protein